MAIILEGDGVELAAFGPFTTEAKARVLGRRAATELDAANAVSEFDQGSLQVDTEEVSSRLSVDELETALRTVVYFGDPEEQLQQCIGDVKGIS